MSEVAVRIVGLREFQAACRAAGDAAPGLLHEALVKAGEPVVEAVRGKVPHGARRGGDKHPGQLAEGYRVAVTGSTGRVVNPVAYAAGAEWGVRGRWAGFARYGAERGRFVWHEVELQADAIRDRVEAGIEQVITVMGWAHG